MAWEAVRAAALQADAGKSLSTALAGQLTELTGAECGQLFLWDDNRRTAPHFATFGSGECDVDVDALEATLVAQAMGSEQPLRQYPEEDSAKATASTLVSALALPLLFSSQPVGAMVLHFRPPRPIESEEERSCQGVAGLLALALAREIAQDAQQRRAEELEALRRASLSLTSKLEPDAVLEVMLKSTLDLIPASDAHIFLYDGERLTFGAARWSGQVPKEPHSNPRESGLTYTVARTGQQVVVPETRDHALYQGEKWNGAIIGMPLRVGQRVMGVMNVAFDRPHRFNDDELRILGLLADQAAVALENAERYRQVERRLAELSALQQVAGVVSRNLETQVLLREVVHQIRSVLGYPVVEVYLVEGDELVQRSALVVQRGDAIKLSMDRGIVGRVARTDQPAFVPDVHQDPDYLEGRPGSRSEIAVPLRKGGVVIGVLNVETADPVGLSEADLRLLTLIADQLSVAIENAALYERLRQHRDELEQAVQQRTSQLADALERAEQASRIKTQFVNDVSHELRTPLSNMRLYVDLLETGKAERRSDYLKTLDRETERLIQLIEDMLTISRMDAGTVSFEPNLLDLNPLAEVLLEDRRKLMEERGLRVEFQPAENLPLVRCDSAMLTQAVAILLTNAMLYTESGGRVRLATDQAVDEGVPWVKLSVADTGLGVREEERGQLFERFFRGSASRSAGTPGTGLGLSIARGVVERHGGRITYRAHPEGGSEFTLWLPPAARGPGEA
jgi:signal transduction histidine kinase